MFQFKSMVFKFKTNLFISIPILKSFYLLQIYLQKPHNLFTEKVSKWKLKISLSKESIFLL